jgi:hypothetical protein
MAGGTANGAAGSSVLQRRVSKPAATRRDEVSRGRKPPVEQKKKSEPQSGGTISSQPSFKLEIARETPIRHDLLRL